MFYFDIVLPILSLILDHPLQGYNTECVRVSNVLKIFLLVLYMHFSVIHFQCQMPIQYIMKRAVPLMTTLVIL